MIHAHVVVAKSTNSAVDVCSSTNAIQYMLYIFYINVSQLFLTLRYSQYQIKVGDYSG